MAPLRAAGEWKRLGPTLAGTALRQPGAAPEIGVIGMGESGQQGVILGCTEPVMLVDPGANLPPVYETTARHAEAAMEWMLT